MLCAPQCSLHHNMHHNVESSSRWRAIRGVAARVGSSVIGVGTLATLVARRPDLHDPADPESSHSSYYQPTAEHQVPHHDLAVGKPWDGPPAALLVAIQRSHGTEVRRGARREGAMWLAVAASPFGSAVVGLTLHGGSKQCWSFQGGCSGAARPPTSQH